MGGLKICHMSADSFFFKNKRSIFHFCRWRVGHRTWGVTKFVIFCGRHKCITPKWFKITTNSIIRGSSFFFNIKPQAGDIFWLRREQPPSPSPHSLLSPLHWSPNQSLCYFQLALNLCEEYFGLLNIASWLASNKSFRTKKCNRYS